MTVAAPAAPPAGRRLSVASNYDELIEAIRARLEELQVSQAALEELAGLTTGHLGKLIGASRVKTLGMMSLFLILEALAVRVVFEEDPELLRKMAGRWEKREDLRRRAGAIKRPISHEVRSAVIHEHMAAIGSRGGRGRNACVAAASARRAAISRWRRARNGNGNGQRR